MVCIEDVDDASFVEDNCRLVDDFGCPGVIFGGMGLGEALFPGRWFEKGFVRIGREVLNDLNEVLSCFVDWFGFGDRRHFVALIQRDGLICFFAL